MVDQDIIDPTGLQNLLDSIGGDESFLGELIEAYLEDSPNLLAEMHQALASNDSEIFRRAAHSLKSNSANFGAMSLSKMSGELEELAKSGALDKASVKLAQVERDYWKVKEALESIRPS